MRHEIPFNTTLHLSDEELTALDAEVEEMRRKFDQADWTRERQLLGMLMAGIRGLAEARPTAPVPTSEEIGEERWPAVSVPEWLRELQAGPAGTEQEE